MNQHSFWTNNQHIQQPQHHPNGYMPNGHGTIPINYNQTGQPWDIHSHYGTGNQIFVPPNSGGKCNGNAYYNNSCPGSGIDVSFPHDVETELSLSKSCVPYRPNKPQVYREGFRNGVPGPNGDGFVEPRPIPLFNNNPPFEKPIINLHVNNFNYPTATVSFSERDRPTGYNCASGRAPVRTVFPDIYNSVQNENKLSLDIPIKEENQPKIAPAVREYTRPKTQSRLSHEKTHRGTDRYGYESQRRSRSQKDMNRRISPRSSRPKFPTSRRRSYKSPLLLKEKNVSKDNRSSRRSGRSSSRRAYPDDRPGTERDKRVENEKEKPNLEANLEKEKQVWTRTAPADLFYATGKQFCSEFKIVHGTKKLVSLCNEFDQRLLKKADKIRANLPKYDPLPRKKRISIKKHDCHRGSSCSSSDSSGSDVDDCTNEELEHKKKHPSRLHQELWFNDSGEMNDGPLCRCSAKARRSGIRHNIYAGEANLPACDPNSNNPDRLFHYRITISPATNFLVATPTVIEHDAHEYIFEGFSMFSHKKLDELPLCKVIRFNIEYTIIYYEENFPQNFTIKELNLFSTYLFKEILELVDLDLRAAGDPEGCPQYHFMPRFVRGLPGNGKEILPMNEVINYLLQSATPLIPRDDLSETLAMAQYDWQRFTESIKGMIVTYPGKKPCSLRVDQLDRDQDDSSEPKFPEIVHFGIRPPQLSYAGNPEYQKAWREYVKFRHLLANMPKPSFDDKRKLEAKEIKLQSMRTKSELKRNVTVTVSCENFHKTGIMCDVVQHAMLIPVLVSHLRFHRSLDVLEEKIKYKFSNRYLLQLALTHPSYRENFGTNPDHARNSLTNCGIRQPVYGDRKIHYQNTRKRGINTLINIMSRFGKAEETESQITHNERLEFLGDAVVEFVSSVHLFHMFSDLEEGGLATYRAAIVQNQHLALLAKVLGLEQYMLYAHGSDLCHDLELRHAMANCFEALMGALFLDGGIEVADKVFGEALFHNEPDLLDIWANYPPHPLQEQEPLGDRKWISKFPWLQSLTKFEKAIGVEFTHIRLLARAFTDRSMGYTNLTLGSNQRLEFLGDTVLQLIASEYLYKYFPEHHEGHLSLLRSSLVNNRTQAVVCDDIGMTQYALYSNPKAELKTKDRADLLEAFLGALYVDKDIEYCQVFCNVCFFPRLQDFIMHQDWNDPKSKLQQCCLTLRTMEGGEPEIPVYKVIECMGPTNTRIYTVAVYFKNRRLAEASGHSIQQAEMNAAKSALMNAQGLFPQLDHQRRVISKSMNRQKRGGPYQRHSPPANKRDSVSSKNNKRKKGKRSSRSLSPKRISTTSKTGDVFSQKIRCRTPPLAYLSKNRSITPELKANDKTKNYKNEDKEGKCRNKDALKKNNSSSCRSREESKDMETNPCCQSTNKVLETNKEVDSKSFKGIRLSNEELKVASTGAPNKNFNSNHSAEKFDSPNQDTKLKSMPPKILSPNEVHKIVKVENAIGEHNIPPTRTRKPHSRDRTPPIRNTSPRHRTPPQSRPNSQLRARAKDPSPRPRNPPQSRERMPSPRTRNPPLSRERMASPRPRNPPQSRERMPSPRTRNPPQSRKRMASPRPRNPPQSRERIPSPRPRSPPQSRGSTSSVRHRNPPQTRERMPSPRPKSPPKSRGRIPSPRPRNPPQSRERNPSVRPRCLGQSRERNPSVRPKSPPQSRGRNPSVRHKSPPQSRAYRGRDKSQQRNRSHKRTPSRSPPRKRSSSKENLEKKMIDFIVGNRSSHGMQTKSQSNTCSMNNSTVAFDQSPCYQPFMPGMPEVPGFSGYGQTPYNPQMRNYTPMYQNGNASGWQNMPGPSTSSHFNNIDPSYHPPNYYY